jgi:hypothetical protein
MLKETKPSGTGSHDHSETPSQIQLGNKTPTPVISSVFGKGGRRGVLQTDRLAGVTQPHDSLQL